MANLIENLVAEHRRLSALTGEMGRMIKGLRDPVPPVFQEKFRRAIDPLIELLVVHGELEARELFPILRKRNPEANQWQVRMVEAQDEMILAEARHFQELFAGAPSPVPAARIKESGAHLDRRIDEHIMIEEQNLFTMLEGSPPG
ncbi:MAG: hemerythrin domain-containing protein [Nitrospirae bacterium]|nr:hemerythrin domain-containing protein [Nitrospirota bacterium]